MWGTPQRSRRISTGCCRPGTGILSACRARAIRLTAARRILFAVGFTIGFGGRRCSSGGRGRVRLAGFPGLAGGFRGGAFVGLFTLTCAIGAVGFGFGLFAIALAVVVHVPAATFELQRGSGDQALDGATTIFVYGQRRIREFLDDLEDITAGTAFIFVEWHCAGPD